MKRVALTSLILLLATLWTKAVTITDIRIVNQQGETSDVSTVAAYTSFEIDQEVSDRSLILAQVAVDVNRMRESGQYSFVKAHIEDYEGGVALVYTVESKPRLIGIRVQGAEHIGNRKLQKKSELEVGRKVDDAVLEQTAVKIEESCKDYWYSNAEVTWEEDIDETLNTVFVTFTVDEGEKLAIRNILFEGNEHYNSSRLKGLLEQKDTRWHSFLTDYGQYEEEAEGLDRFSLQSFYMNEGFLDVMVSEPVLDDSNPRKSTLTYQIEEGPRYVVGRVYLTGMQDVDEMELLSLINLEEGDVASDANIGSNSEALRAYYGNKGYINANVRAIRHADEESGVVDIEFVISEGSIGYINKINITGNEWTSDKVIRRELLVYPSEKYNRQLMNTSRRILQNLNFFDSVTVTPEPTAKKDMYDLNIQVNEQQTGQFMTGVGFSSIDAIVGYVELSEGNFSFKQWPPKGDGQKFKIRAQLGTRRSDLEISFVEPWFMNRRLMLGIDLYHRESSYYSSQYDLRTDGFRVSLTRPIKYVFGIPVNNRLRGTLGYALEQFDVYDVDPLASPVILAEAGARTKSTLDYTVLYDTRNYSFLPSRGTMASVTPYISGGSLGGQTDLYGFRGRFSQYWSQTENSWILSLRGTAQAVDTFGDSKDSSLYGEGVPLFDRFFLGGANSIRGFDYRDVSPQDSGQPIGGNSAAYASAELTYPIWKKVRGAIFYDCGFVNEDSWDFDPSSFHDDWGIGIRFDMMQLPLQLDYAWPLNYDDNLTGKPRFNFNMSRSF